MQEWSDQLFEQKQELLRKTADEDSPLRDAVGCLSSLKAVVGYGAHVIGLAASVFHLSTQKDKTWSDWLNLTGYSMGVVRNARLIPFRVIQLLDNAQPKVGVYSHLPDFEEMKRLISAVNTQARESQPLYALCHPLGQHYRAHIENPVVGSLEPDTDIRYDMLYAIVNHVLEVFQSIFILLKLVTAANEALVRELPNPVVRLPSRNLPS
ncbi:hypothetical protein E5K00_06965 [Hymenobacter aquaticus]|uniref:Uncharacterized protein n=2 Tax=Hymenobacter aquaticus TaxID=1867101 RepID=A0A4Z0Q5Q0_9BACT|nr:hypothetical protein E5K00_06965 [Hymenobacter aquaticus]